MEVLSGLTQGLNNLLQPINIFLMCLGALVGIWFGLLRVLSPTGTVAAVLAITFGLPPIEGIVLLTALTFGVLYGNVLPRSQLIGSAAKLPATRGFRFSLVSGALLPAAVIAFVAAAISPTVASTALLLGLAEYAAIMILVLSAMVASATGSMIRAMTMCIFGLLLSMVGSDLETGMGRMTFDEAELADGIGFVNIAVGVFVIADMMRNFGSMVAGDRLRFSAMTQTPPSILRAIGLGIFGGLTGAGSKFLLDSNTRDSPEGERDSAGQPDHPLPSAAEKDVLVTTSFVPFMILGLPTHALGALIVGAFAIHGIVPGPQVITKQPELYWVVFVSVIAIHLVLIPIVLIGGRIYNLIASTTFSTIAPFLFAYCCAAIYSVNNSPFDVACMLVFGVFGVIMIRFDFDRNMLLTAFVLGPLLEENLRRTFLIARGSLPDILGRPIAGSILLLAGVILIIASVVRLPRNAAVSPFAARVQGRSA